MNIGETYGIQESKVEQRLRQLESILPIGSRVSIRELVRSRWALADVALVKGGFRDGRTILPPSLDNLALGIGPPRGRRTRQTVIAEGKFGSLQ